jgi:hypothetical protein
MVPWSLAFEDSDSAGKLSLRYWFRCKSEIGTVDAKYFHHGGGWIAEEVQARVGQRSYELLNEPPR